MNIKLQILFILFIISTNCGCQTSNSNSLLQININPERKNYINLSTLTDSITYIPLKTEKIIGGMSRIRQYNDRYYILDAKSSIIFCFNNKGEYQFHIDRSGRGPGEYLKPINMAINPYNNHIMVISSALHKILTFDLDGNYISEENTKSWMSDLEVMDSNRFLVYDLNPVGATEHRSMCVITSPDMQEWYMKAVPFFRGKHSFGVTEPYNLYNGTWKVVFAFDNIIYTINNKGIEPYYKINFGKHTLPEELIGEHGQITLDNIRTAEYNNQIRYCNRLSYVFETSKLISFMFEYGSDWDRKDRLKYAFYLKNSDEYILADEIINDIDGVPIKYVKYLTNDENYLSFIWPHEILELAKKEGKEKLSRFFERFPNLSENDNPILMIYNIKDF